MTQLRRTGERTLAATSTVLGERQPVRFQLTLLEGDELALRSGAQRWRIVVEDGCMYFKAEAGRSGREQA